MAPEPEIRYLQEDQYEFPEERRYPKENQYEFSEDSRPTPMAQASCAAVCATRASRSARRRARTRATHARHAQVARSQLLRVLAPPPGLSTTVPQHTMEEQMYIPWAPGVWDYVEMYDENAHCSDIDVLLATLQAPNVDAEKDVVKANTINPSTTAPSMSAAAHPVFKDAVRTSVSDREPLLEADPQKDTKAIGKIASKGVAKEDASLKEAANTQMKDIGRMDENGVLAQIPIQSINTGLGDEIAAVPTIKASEVIHSKVKEVGSSGALNKPSSTEEVLQINKHIKKFDVTEWAINATKQYHTKVVELPQETINHDHKEQTVGSYQWWVLDVQGSWEAFASSESFSDNEALEARYMKHMAEESAASIKMKLQGHQFKVNFQKMTLRAINNGGIGPRLKLRRKKTATEDAECLRQ